VKPGRTHIDAPSFKGDLYEHIAIVEAMKRGAYVYKNVGCSGKTDMIIQKGDITLHVDVKASSSHKCPARGVSLVHVDVDTHQVRWGRPRTIPTLWSEFWT
jgi:Holliday junction resolvase-like predicted endonuclease